MSKYSVLTNFLVVEYTIKLLACSIAFSIKSELAF